MYWVLLELIEDIISNNILKKTTNSEIITFNNDFKNYHYYLKNVKLAKYQKILCKTPTNRITNIKIDIVKTHYNNNTKINKLFTMITQFEYNYDSICWGYKINKEIMKLLDVDFKIANKIRLDKKIYKEYKPIPKKINNKPIFTFKPNKISQEAKDVIYENYNAFFNKKSMDNILSNDTFKIIKSEIIKTIDNNFETELDVLLNKAFNNFATTVEFETLFYNYTDIHTLNNIVMALHSLSIGDYKMNDPFKLIFYLIMIGDEEQIERFFSQFEDNTFNFNTDILKMTGFKDFYKHIYENIEDIDIGKINKIQIEKISLKQLYLFKKHPSIKTFINFLNNINLKKKTLKKILTLLKQIS